MHVPLRAYAEDCSITGEVALSGDRLSDFLSTTTEFEVVNLSCRALDDGRVVDALFAPVLRDDLCLVVAGEPRGREDLRVWTRQFPVVAHVGPYVVRGYVHTPPTIDPLQVPRRRAIVPLTSTSVAFEQAGTRTEIQADTVLLNSRWIETFEAATTGDVEATGSDSKPDPVVAPRVGESGT